MSTKYFLLSKAEGSTAHDNAKNQIVYLNSRQVYILPQVNLEYYAKNGLFENQLIEWCKQFCRPDKIFLDIGAHTGTYALQLASKCKEVHAFEPQRMTYYALCGSIALSGCHNIHAHNFGLGSQAQVGKQTLNIVSNDGGGSSIHHNTADKILKTEEIHICTLDELNIDNIGFMKMDVEDNELFVLQGGRETILRSGCPPFIFESNRKNDALFNYITNELHYKVIPISGSVNMYLAALQ